jgi:hypothetical protein
MSTHHDHHPEQDPEQDRDLCAERWMPVPGFETAYEVSDHGRVRSLARTITRGYRSRTGLRQPVPARVLRPSRNTSGTLKVNLSRPGRSGPLTRAVHLLVLTTFVGLRPPGHTGRHLNDDQTDNHLPNLAWRPGRQRPRRKPDCIRGHLLQEPNLVPSGLARDKRACLACARAHNGRHRAANRNRAYDLQTEADEHYIQIMQNHSQQTSRKTQP